MFNGQNNKYAPLQKTSSVCFGEHRPQWQISVISFWNWQLALHFQFEQVFSLISAISTDSDSCTMRRYNINPFFSRRSHWGRSCHWLRFLFSLLALTWLKHNCCLLLRVRNKLKETFWLRNSWPRSNRLETFQRICWHLCLLLWCLPGFITIALY